MSNITLTTSETATLASLSSVTQLFSTTQNELNTGKKVNSAADNAVAYFQSQSLYNRASTITTRKSNIDQSIQSLTAALTATSAVDSLLKELQGVLEGARGATLSARQAATQQFSNIGKQLAQLVKDASYQGLNLLTSTAASLSTQFSERTAATFTIKGYNLVSTAAGNGNSLFTAAVLVFSSAGKLIFSQVVASGAGAGTVKGFSSLDVTGTAAGTVKASVAATIFSNTDNRLSSAITQNAAITSALGTNVAILQTRSSFAASYSATLTGGGDKLTLADLNTAAAQSQALSLRQQIGIQSLSVENSQAQSILNLLR
jgi:flagellin-like hook-associated protein FlgL